MALIEFYKLTNFAVDVKTVSKILKCFLKS